MVNSLLSGSANAFLTLRVGIIAKDYCGVSGCRAQDAGPPRGLGEAARLLSGIVKESGARVREAIWREIKLKIPRPWPLKKGQPEHGLKPHARAARATSSATNGLPASARPCIR